MTAYTIPEVGPYWSKNAPPMDVPLENCREETTKHFDNSALMHAESSFHARWAQFLPLVPPIYYSLLEESPKGNPPRYEVEVDGKKIMASVSSVEFAAMAARLIPWLKIYRVKYVLEIGGGYGGLAATILKAMPDLKSWSIVDIQKVGRISRWYLEDEERAHVYGLMDAGGFLTLDAVVQTRGFMEMSPAELEFWFRLIQESYLKPGGILWTINRLEKVSCFAEYPFDRKWLALHKAPWPEGDMIEVALIRTNRDAEHTVAEQLDLKRRRP